MFWHFHSGNLEGFKGVEKSYVTYGFVWSWWEGVVPGYLSTNFCTVRWFGYSAAEYKKPFFPGLPVVAILPDTKQAKVSTGNQEGRQLKPQLKLATLLQKDIIWLPICSSILVLLDRKGQNKKKGAKMGPKPLAHNSFFLGPCRSMALPLLHFAFSKGHF